MEFNLITISAFLSGLIQFLIGARILMLAQKSRGATEALVGLMLFLIGTGRFTELASAGFIGPNILAADVATKLQYGISHLLLFVIFRRIFRPHAIWALGFLIFATLILLGGIAVQLLTGWDFSVPGWGTRYNEVRLYTALTAFVWGAVECYLHTSKLKRQLKFGLTSPEMLIRTLLWGVSMTATIIIVISICMQIYFGLISSTNVHVIWFVMILISNISFWFSFIPPKFLRRAFVKWFDRGI